MLNKKLWVNDAELNRYADSVQGFLDGKVDADRFQSIRLQQGVYGQRQQGVNMVRIKIPGGQLNPQQAHTIAEVVDAFSQHDSAHITTRQAIQIHYIPLRDTAAAIRRLATAGLTSREACNNTVRNMSACSLSGVCPAEHTDVRVFLERAASHFLRHPLTQHLPRKFKISFSGCEQDCAQGMIHDLAVVAVRHEGQFGFKILAGGGLGHKPREAIVVEDFIPEEDLLACMEAVIAVHHRYSNRKLRAKSRIKFLVDRFGKEGFIEKYREALLRTRTALASTAAVQGLWHKDSIRVDADPGAPRKILAQKQLGLNVIPVSVAGGNITVAQLHGLAELMLHSDLDDLRTSQDQNLMIVGVKDENITTIVRGGKALDLNMGVKDRSFGSTVVTCPGTSTCRLGITSSTLVAPALFSEKDTLRIAVSGCHNGCAQPESADIGIYGEGKRLHGKLIPHYQIYLGGDGRGNRGLGFKTRSVPVANIESALADIKTRYADNSHHEESFYAWSRRLGKTYFDALLVKHAEVSVENIDTLLRDHGGEADFRVIKFGGGECAGAAQETVAANFSGAANECNYRDAFLLQNEFKNALASAELALRLVGNSLLFLAAESPPDELLLIAEKIKSVFSHDADINQHIAQALEQFSEKLMEFNNDFNKKNFQRLIVAMDAWSLRVAALCENMDQQLDLSAVGAKNRENKKNIIDLSSFGCPLHYIKARNMLRQFEAGEVVQFIFASGEAVQQASSSIAKDGHEIVNIEKRGITTAVSVRKAG